MNRGGLALLIQDYLTKWVEVFPTPDQSALTIAKLLITEIISRHGVPRELLSDRSAAFPIEVVTGGVPVDEDPATTKGAA